MSRRERLERTYDTRSSAPTIEKEMDLEGATR